MHRHKHPKSRACNVKSAIICLTTIASCKAFQMHTRHTANRHAYEVVRSNYANAVIRFASENNNDAKDEDLSGRELAAKFTEELKRRESLSAANVESLETYEINTPPPPPKPIRKFTGASTPLFTNSNSNDQSSSNLERERQREFNLASRFERTFPIQAAILLASAIFISLVGLSGGITDGSERNFYGDDDLIEDAVVEQLERIRTDDAGEARGSYWL